MALCSGSDGSPLQSVPEAPDDGRAVGASDGLLLRAADVMQDVVAPLHYHLNPSVAQVRIQRPGSGRQVLDAHVVFP